jgi:putative endonuclease
MPFYVYILFSESLQQYYTGSTQELSKRLNDHNNGWSKHTSKGAPWILVYSEEFAIRSEACLKIYTNTKAPSLEKRPLLE